ncbi:MAG TPA: prepilin-type N-terminal cleavage/methylation domain-containing protein [Aridibacter sp.]|nr:prepilin-type N-terminal cleavage/methylation domain-containing protein [Aridibacter sp.]
MKNQKGFSLVELLVVVIIIAIIAAIAIPSLLASRRAANEASAISSLRTVHSANVTYFGTTGLNTNYGDLAALLGDGLIDSQLGGGAKSGYTFAANTGASIYCASGVATTQGTTGVRSFAVDETGVVVFYADGSAACAAGVKGAAGTPIQ